MFREKEEFTPWQESIHNIYEFEEKCQNFSQKKHKDKSVLPRFRKLSHNYHKKFSTQVETRKISQVGILFPTHNRLKIKSTKTQQISVERKKEKSLKMKIPNPFPMEGISFLKRYKTPKVQSINRNTYTSKSYAQSKLWKFNLFR